MSTVVIAALSGAILILYAVLARRDIAAATALFLALLPAYLVRFRIPLPLPAPAELPTTLLELLFATLFLSWLLARKAGTRHDLRRWAYGMTLLAVGATIGIAVSPSPVAAAGLWRAYIIEPFLFFVMFVDVVRGPRDRKLVLGAFGALIAAIGLTAVYQKLTGFGIPNPYWQAEATRRVTSVFGFPNAIGLLCAPLAVLMAGWAAALVRPLRAPADALFLLPAASAFLGCLGVLFAVSEGAYVGLATGIAALGLLLRRTRKIALVAVIVGCVAVTAYRPLTDYVSVMASLRDDSGSVRKIIWSESLAMLEDRPIFGAGLSGYPDAIVPYHEATHIEIFQYPHSIALNFWSETGIIGLVGFLLVVGAYLSVIVGLIRARPDEWLPAALAAAMVALLVHGLVDVPYFKNDLAFMFWALVGLAESMRRQVHDAKAADASS